MPQRVTSPLRALLSGASVAVVGDLLARTISLILTVLVTRALGPTLYGEYTSVLSSLALIASIIGFGLDTWLLREGGRNPTKLLDYAASVLLTKFIAACCVVLGLLALGNRISISVPFLIGCLGVLADTFLNTGFAALRARQRNSMVALTQFILPALLLMLLLLLQSSARAVLSPLLLIALQSAISWVVVLVLYWRGLHLLDGRRPQINLRVVAFGAWAFVIADLLANIYGQSATLQLRAATGVLEVGLFRPALNILNVTYIMPAIVFSVSLPLLSSPTTSRPNYLRIIRLWVLGALGYGLLVGLLLNFGAPLIMTLVYDPRFAASAPILQVLSPATLFKVSSFACTLVMLSRNRQTLRIALQTIAVLLNVVLGAWVIPSYGLRGAAWITLGTEIVLFLLYAGGALWALKTWKDPITLKQTSTSG